MLDPAPYVPPTEADRARIATAWARRNPTFADLDLPRDDPRIALAEDPGQGCDGRYCDHVADLHERARWRD